MPPKRKRIPSLPRTVKGKLPPKAKAKSVGAPVGNQNAVKHRWYSKHFSKAESELVAAFTSDLSLDDEIWAQRVVNRRILASSQTDDLDTLIKVGTALAIGTGRVAKLLRDKRALSGEAADGLAGAIAQALEEISTEMGLAL